jgi:hypothetical protein
VIARWIITLTVFFASLVLLTAPPAIAYTHTECVKMEEKEGTEKAVAEEYCTSKGDIPERAIISGNAKELGEEGLGIVLVIISAISILIAMVIIVPKGVVLIKRFI